ncbi:Kelch motif family protein [Aphelenchoides avenae]|nr:Kelch motif family protein [Aphelenchus avenae]
MRWSIHLEGGPKRVNHAAVAIGDKIYSFGGYCSGEVRGRNEPIDVHVLDPITLRWKCLSSEPHLPLTNVASTSGSVTAQHGSEFWYRRERGDNAEVHPLAQIRFDHPADDDEFEDMETDDDAEMPAAHRIHMVRFNPMDAGLMDDYSEDDRESDEDEDEDMSGNETDEMSDSEYEEMLEHRRALAEEAAKRAVPYQRYGHTVVAYKNRAYLWGGRNDDFGASSTLHEYDPAKNKWSIIEVQGPNPPSRDGHTAVVWNDRMYVFGGFEEETQRFSQETYYFDFLAKTWTQVVTEGEPPQYRDFHTACVIDGRMWVFGGRSDEMGQFHSSQDIYCDRLRCLDLRTERWSAPEVTGDRPCGRRSHSVWVYKDEMYIFGGYISTKDAHFNDTYAFNPTTCHWRLIEPAGAPPLPRRRQCTVVVADRVFLFGGTMPQRAKKATNELLDLGDLHVLDIAPNLQTLCLEAVLRHRLFPKYQHMLPMTLRNQLKYMTTPNSIPAGIPRVDTSG